jgi:hypothetical protein
MYLNIPIEWYYFRANLIWPGATFKSLILKLNLTIQCDIIRHIPHLNFLAVIFACAGLASVRKLMLSSTISINSTIL